MIAASIPAADDPYAIYARTRSYWESQHYPSRVEYDVVVRVVDGGKPKIERYRSGFDAQEASVHFDAVSDEEAAHPYTPHGFNVFLPGLNLSKAEVPVDYLGVPVLAPNYSFGIAATPRATTAAPSSAELIREIRAEFHDPDPRGAYAPSPAPDGTLPEIASVVSKTRAYDIAFAGSELLDGVPTYHLQMQPLREPHRYRLRDLWVDAQTFAPCKLVEALNFRNGPGTAVPWSVTFSQIGGVTYVATETALEPMSYERQTYAQASVSIENLHPVDVFSPGLSTFVPEDGPLIMEEP